MFKLFTATKCLRRFNPITDKNLCFFHDMFNITPNKKYLLFFVELLVVVLINFMPAILGPILKGDGFKVSFSTTMVLAIIIFMQFIFQWAGFLPKGETCNAKNCAI